MKKEKKLSIIIPMYNGKKRIKKCIQSIFAQTYPNLELILIDDGSGDDTYEMARKAVEEAEKAQREAGTSQGEAAAGRTIEVRLLHQENHGVAYTRNYGISLASGEYVTFVDQDDYILPEYCAVYMQAAETSDADIVIGGFERITDEGKVTRTVRLKQAEWSKFIVTAPWAHIYRTEFIRENQIQFLSTGIGEDIYFNLVAYAYTDRITILPDHSYRWVDNPRSVSNSRQNSINVGSNPLYLLNALIKRLPGENKLGREYEEYFFMRYIVWYFSFTVRNSRKEDVKEMYFKLMEWLRKHFPEYRENPNIRISRPAGDPLAIRISVWLFYRLERLGLLPKCLELPAKKDVKRI